MCATEEIINSQKETLGISDFLNASKEYTKNNLEDIDFDNLFEGLIKGNINSKIFGKNILKIISNEVLEISNLMIDILIVIIIHSILNAIIEDLGNTTTGKVAYYVQYLVIASLIIKSTKIIMDLTSKSIEELSGFMNMLIPLLTTLSITTGSVTTSTMIEPILILIVNVSGSFIRNFIIPLVSTSIILSIVSNLSDKVQIGKISNFLKSIIVWVLGILLTIFVGILSIEGNLGSSVDGLTAKTAKATISNLIPVVGKILGDSVDSVIGCANILKNTVGIIGVIIIIAIVIKPLLKILITFFYFKLTSAISEIIADKKITNLVNQISDGYKILLGVFCANSVMFIVGITLVLKITNNALMYR